MWRHYTAARSVIFKPPVAAPSTLSAYAQANATFIFLTLEVPNCQLLTSVSVIFGKLGNSLKKCCGLQQQR